MSWVVFWIDPSEGGSQIGVALTTMLTLIAYRFAVGSELPNIPYLTRMDYFLLASTVLVFATLIEVVITSHYARSGRIQQAHRIDLWARWMFPAVFVFLTLHAFMF
jgi:cadmium resistance protein CadD (predicted permease)